MPTALIVEDEPDANALLSMLVRLRGYRTESALGGSEALRLLDRCRPDVVLLDLMLPDIDGFEVCRTIKADRETALIPVVIVSATRASENESRSYGAGANDFVPKPYTPDQIFRALEAAEAWRRDLASRPGARGLRASTPATRSSRSGSSRGSGASCGPGRRWPRGTWSRSPRRSGSPGPRRSPGAVTATTAGRSPRSASGSRWAGSP